MTKIEAANIEAARKAIEAEYAPYHTMVAFEVGFDTYINNWMSRDCDGVDGQAYDRGMECAMRVMRGEG